MNKLMSIFAVATVFFGIASARMAYQFGAGYQDIIGEPVETFTCEGRPYGYYADTDNECKVFHVCNPISNDLGEIVRVDQYSFVCGNQTIFNQESLTCTHPIDAFPCEDAASLYDLVNSEFGRIIDNEENL